MRGWRKDFVLSCLHSQWALSSSQSRTLVLSFLLAMQPRVHKCIIPLDIKGHMPPFVSSQPEMHRFTNCDTALISAVNPHYENCYCWHQRPCVLVCSFSRQRQQSPVHSAFKIGKPCRISCTFQSDTDALAQASSHGPKVASYRCRLQQ
jgi:hypothetical protein